ncbi:tRNA(Ile)(2)-agmatinylcytidine synthase [Ignisphaera sp. 4213-co]|uniref:tRNA(Ile2) 2-agmatinylcytidine synthetase TiaS n=1 Tax=Ignisphaera cupida TaxID=3050454 RepID=A0ABD4Z6S8_9CREN|nr:tRNA(Ile)(2)-agmatinylcytidine synthase [Ignisphaera sp. 4213-co]MDK6027818.1 tRNA(Ile)(2)-agmatinylcytidine synthase [Ignisphaera sp. 4213-co]
MNYNSNICCVHLGLDDFDLLKYGCTTHLATYVLNELPKKIGNVFLIDYPNLVRLNPSIPWKTRGNGAIAIRFCTKCDQLENAENVLLIVESIVDKYIDSMTKEFDLVTPDFEPGLVIATNVSSELTWIYEKALTDVIIFDDYLKKKFEERGIIFSQRYSGRGVIGALAAIAWFYKEDDYTYELLTYRSKKFYGTKRCVDENSVKVFDSITKNSTFNNYDYNEKRVLITPRGFDPVLYGVRGETPSDVKKALSIIKTCEPVVAWTIFRSNQATDAHAMQRSVSDLKPFRTGKAKIVIGSKPYRIRGGAVIIKAFDGTGEIVLVFFKPSQLNRIAEKLSVGDLVEVQGHVKKWNELAVFHVEKMVVLKTLREFICTSPTCPQCGSKMSKKGFGKGYKCEKCGYVDFNPKLTCKEKPRQVESKMYLPPLHAQKHLIKPLARYSKEKKFTPRLVQLIAVSETTNIIEPLQFL